MPTTPLVAGKQAAPGASSHFNVLFKRSRVLRSDIANKGLSASIAATLQQEGFTKPGRMFAGKKMLESSIERV